MLFFNFHYSCVAVSYPNVTNICTATYVMHQNERRCAVVLCSVDIYVCTISSERLRECSLTGRIIKQLESEVIDYTMWEYFVYHIYRPPFYYAYTGIWIYIPMYIHFYLSNRMYAGQNCHLVVAMFTFYSCYVLDRIKYWNNKRQRQKLRSNSVV